jgi:3-hydroxyacyl-CoA dehydrogenase / enoyl-CoA hydratase / 3-hydroxybutyryl-CoA epimerase
MIFYKKDYQNIVTLTLDMKGRSVNIINHEVANALIPVLVRLEKDKLERQLVGVIIVSAKRSFLAGGDLDYLHNSDDPKVIFDYSMTLNNVFRRLELLNVPVVAAINGAALGSGYELTLACHYRIALDGQRTVIGLPEVAMGMMPGGGGIVRLTWLLGVAAAFDILSKGKAYHCQEALRKGLIDKIVYTERELLEEAKAFILSKPTLTKPWDTGNSPPPLSNPKNIQTAQLINELNAQLLKKTWDNYPAPQAILNTIYECMQVEFNKAMTIVSRQFTALVLSPKCSNMTKAFWYDFNKIKNGLSRPKGFGRFKARKIGIIGAGAMGAGIAYLAVMQNIQVVLKDITISVAEQGKIWVRQALQLLLDKQKINTTQLNTMLDRISTTDNHKNFEDCDLVLEAVFENIELKTRIVREAEMYVHKDAFIASNSATLSISEIANKGLSNANNFIGMHFFTPVLNTKLVEIVTGKETSLETVARAFDFALQLNKVPIVAKDKIGFYTLRVFRTYLLEGLALLSEGQKPAYVRNCALQAGMEEGPFVLADQLSLSFILELERKTETIQGENYTRHPAIAVLEKMVLELKRQGKYQKGGFYEYGVDDEKHFWSGLAEHFPTDVVQYNTQTIKDRIIFVQCIEAAKCLEENIVNNAADANLGSIYGWGFPAFEGGVLQYINTCGFDYFKRRAAELEIQFGNRFTLPKILNDMAEQQLNFI